MVEFAINSSISSMTGFAPFKVVSGYMPEMLRQIPDALNTPPGVKAFAVQALGNITAAHDSIIVSQVFQWHYANLWHCEEPIIRKDDFIFLLTKNLSMPKGG